jgi:hypothetical protein
MGLSERDTHSKHKNLYSRVLMLKTIHAHKERVCVAFMIIDLLNFRVFVFSSLRDCISFWSLRLEIVFDYATRIRSLLCVVRRMSEWVSEWDSFKNEREYLTQHVGWKYAQCLSAHKLSRQRSDSLFAFRANVKKERRESVVVLFHSTVRSFWFCNGLLITDLRDVFWIERGREGGSEERE